MVFCCRNYLKWGAAGGPLKGGEPGAFAVMLGGYLETLRRKHDV